MQLELSPVIEVCLDFTDFCNVDLVQRGYYQLRTRLKVPSKYGSNPRIDIQCPRNTGLLIFMVIDRVVVVIVEVFKENSNSRNMRSIQYS